MKQLVAGVVGVLLVLVPGWMFFNGLRPMPQYRSGTWSDYQGVLVAWLWLYGGAALGIAWRWWRSARLMRTIGGVEVFRAGFAGVMALTAAWVVGAGVYGWLIRGSVGEGLGNLWGLVVIFGAVLGAVVAAGAGLIWYAIHGQTRPPRT